MGFALFATAQQAIAAKDTLQVEDLLFYIFNKKKSIYTSVVITKRYLLTAFWDFLRI